MEENLERINHTNSIGIHLRLFEEEETAGACGFSKCAVPVDRIISSIQNYRKNNESIFISTWNPRSKVVSQLRSYFGNETIFFAKRCEGVEDLHGLVDQIILTKTKYFIGNPISTFSIITEIWRGGKNSAYFRSEHSDFFLLRIAIGASIVIIGLILPFTRKISISFLLTVVILLSLYFILPVSTIFLFVMKYQISIIIATTIFIVLILYSFDYLSLNIFSLLLFLSFSLILSFQLFHSPYDDSFLSEGINLQGLNYPWPKETRIPGIYLMGEESILKSNTSDTCHYLCLERNHTCQGWSYFNYSLSCHLKSTIVSSIWNPACTSLVK